MTDDQLQSLFAGMERRLDRRIDGIAGRVDGLAADIKALATRLDQVDGRFDAVYAKIEKVETTLLTEFHKWASPMESRMQTHRL